MTDFNTFARAYIRSPEGKREIITAAWATALFFGFLFAFSAITP